MARILNCDMLLILCSRNSADKSTLSSFTDRVAVTKAREERFLKTFQNSYLILLIFQTSRFSVKTGVD